MNKFSELIDKFYCTKMQAKSADDFVEFGRYLAGETHLTSPGLMVDFEKGNQLLIGNPAFTLPQRSSIQFSIAGKTLEHDLWVPYAYLDMDKIPRIQFPGWGAPLPSKAAGHDWRLLLMASQALLSLELEDTPDLVIFEIFYPEGHVTRATVKRFTWNILGRVAAWAQDVRAEAPGLWCQRCLVRDTCKPYLAYLEVREGNIPFEMDKKRLAQRLILEVSTASLREEHFKERRKIAEKHLLNLTREGYIDVGAYKMAVVNGKSDKFPFNQTYELLTQQGCWNPEFARINVKALKKVMYKFPPEVRAILEGLKFTGTGEPKIREAVDANQDNVQASIFKGVSL